MTIEGAAPESSAVYHTASMNASVAQQAHMAQVYPATAIPTHSRSGSLTAANFNTARGMPFDAMAQLGMSLPLNAARAAVERKEPVMSHAAAAMLKSNGMYGGVLPASAVMAAAARSGGSVASMGDLYGDELHAGMGISVDDAGTGSADDDGLPKRDRKPYTMTKARELWTPEEHQLFLESLKLYERDWKRIAEHIGTKSVIQIRSHAQKYFIKMQKLGLSTHIPPARPKRKAKLPYPRARKEPDAKKSNQQNSPAAALARANAKLNTNRVAEAVALASAAATAAVTASQKQLALQQQARHALGSTRDASTPVKLPPTASAVAPPAVIANPGSKAPAPASVAAGRPPLTVSTTAVNTASAPVAPIPTQPNSLFTPFNALNGLPTPHFSMSPLSPFPFPHMWNFPGQPQQPNSSNSTLTTTQGTTNGATVTTTPLSNSPYVDQQQMLAAMAAMQQSLANQVAKGTSLVQPTPLAALSSSNATGSSSSVSVAASSPTVSASPPLTAGEMELNSEEIRRYAASLLQSQLKSPTPVAFPSTPTPAPAAPAAQLPNNNKRKRDDADIKPVMPSGTPQAAALASFNSLPTPPSLPMALHFSFPLSSPLPPVSTPSPAPIPPVVPHRAKFASDAVGKTAADSSAANNETGETNKKQKVASTASDSLLAVPSASAGAAATPSAAVSTPAFVSTPSNPMSVSGLPPLPLGFNPSTPMPYGLGMPYPFPLHFDPALALHNSSNSSSNAASSSAAASSSSHAASTSLTLPMTPSFPPMTPFFPSSPFTYAPYMNFPPAMPQNSPTPP